MFGKCIINNCKNDAFYSCSCNTKFRFCAPCTSEHMTHPGSHVYIDLKELKSKSKNAKIDSEEKLNTNSLLCENEGRELICLISSKISEIVRRNEERLKKVNYLYLSGAIDENIIKEIQELGTNNGMLTHADAVREAISNHFSTCYNSEVYPLYRILEKSNEYLVYGNKLLSAICESNENVNCKLLEKIDRLEKSIYRQEEKIKMLGETPGGNSLLVEAKKKIKIKISELANKFESSLNKFKKEFDEKLNNQLVQNLANSSVENEIKSSMEMSKNLATAFSETDNRVKALQENMSSIFNQFKMMENRIDEKIKFKFKSEFPQLETEINYLLNFTDMLSNVFEDGYYFLQTIKKTNDGKYFLICNF